MSQLYAFAAAGLFGCGLYMVLSRNLVRLLLGLSLLTTAVNLAVFQGGRIRSVQPPLIPEGAQRLGDSADPVPQALILTAIVISMGVAAFVLALAYRSYQLTTVEEVSNDPEDTRVAERVDDDNVDRDIPDVVPARDTDAPDELDALPGAEGSR